MSQPDTDKARVADRRSEETRSFVRQVRAATRRKYTPEEKIRIVLEGFRREVTVNDLCRREGIKPHSYYAWTKEFMEAGKERLSRDTVRDATRQEIVELGGFRLLASLGSAIDREAILGGGDGLMVSVTPAMGVGTRYWTLVTR